MIITTSILTATAVAASTAGKLVAVGKALAAIGTVVTAVQSVSDRIRDN